MMNFGDYGNMGPWLILSYGSGIFLEQLKNNIIMPSKSFEHPGLELNPKSPNYVT
jgi:hypothetical protein